jgi:hypothetical protein
MPFLAICALAALTPDSIMARTIEATRVDTHAWHERITLQKHQTIAKQPGETVQDELLLFGESGYTFEWRKQHNGIAVNESPQLVNVEISRLITEQASCFTFTFADPGVGMHHGRPVYVLTFAPRSPACESDSDEEHIAFLTKGTVRIDQERFCIWQVRGELSQSISKKIICVISSCAIEFEQTTHDDLVIPLRLESIVEWSCLFKGKTRERRTNLYDTPAPKVP